MLPDIAALYGQNSCSRVLLFRDRDEGIKKSPRSQALPEPSGAMVPALPRSVF